VGCTKHARRLSHIPLQELACNSLDSGSWKPQNVTAGWRREADRRVRNSPNAIDASASETSAPLQTGQVAAEADCHIGRKRVTLG